MKYINHFEDFKKISYGNKDFEYEKIMIIMSDDEIVDYIIKNCSEFIERPTLIYRTVNAKVNFLGVSQ
ncbi:MAG: hypothetical protein HPY57_15895 [Ignavibacteria bacterium]|nr:hypothetical protein [Ignavibacteria bacterium]